MRKASGFKSRVTEITTRPRERPPAALRIAAATNSLKGPGTRLVTSVAAFAVSASSRNMPPAAENEHLMPYLQTGKSSIAMINSAQRKGYSQAASDHPANHPRPAVRGGFLRAAARPARHHACRIPYRRPACVGGLLPGFGLRAGVPFGRCRSYRRGLPEDQRPPVHRAVPAHRRLAAPRPDAHLLRG